MIGFIKARKRSIILNWLVHPSRRVIFRKQKIRGGWEPAGQRAEVSLLYYFFIDGNQTRPKGHQT